MRTRLAALLLLALPALAFAQYKPWYNFFNFAYGAKACSMGNAFTAVADDLTAVFWNPAGLATRRGPEFYLGYKSGLQRHDYDLQDNGQARDESRVFNFNFANKLKQIDFFAVSAPVTLLGRPCAFVLGYYRYIPYGFMGTAKEVLTFLRPRTEPRSGTVTFSGSEGVDVLAFSASVNLSEFFSLGATLQQFFSSGTIATTRVDKVGEDLLRESQSELTEKLQGRNGIIGVMFTPFQQLRLGVTWHSSLKSRFNSTLLTWEVGSDQKKTQPGEKSSQARVEIPQQVALGVLLRPAGWLDLSADYSRLDWDTATIDGYFAATTTLPYPQKDDWPQAQQQSRNLRFGAEARLPFRTWQLSLRGGWSLDRQLYADTTGEAVKVKGYSAGIGCEFSRNLLVEITFQRQVADWPEKGFFNLSPDVPTHYRANVFFLALNYRFGHIFKE